MEMLVLHPSFVKLGSYHFNSSLLQNTNLVLNASLNISIIMSTDEVNKILFKFSYGCLSFIFGFSVFNLDNT
jgi:hypothetical protein